MEVERYCLNCDNAIRGRIDKKYCDDNCRNQYNNRQTSNYLNEIRNIHYILRRNRQILSDLLGELNKNKLPIDRLREAGYQFDYLTQICNNNKGVLYRYCYDCGYTIVNNKWVLLIRK